MEYSRCDAFKVHDELVVGEAGTFRRGCHSCRRVGPSLAILGRWDSVGDVGTIMVRGQEGQP
jgi:hypothetical protein